MIRDLMKTCACLAFMVSLAPLCCGAVLLLRVVIYGY